MRNMQIMLLVSAVAFMLTGCNTISGAGTDIKQGGKAIEKAADKHK